MVRERKLPLSKGQRVGYVSVNRVVYGGGDNISEHESENKIIVPEINMPCGYVRVEGSVTKNLGDYNSARVAVMVELPCLPSEDGARDAYEAASDMVDRWIQEEIEIATQSKG